MKIKLLILLLIAGCLLSAQEVSHAKKFNIGASGGIQFNNIEQFGSFSTSSRLGYFIGFLGEYSFSPSFKVSAELQYDRRNFEITDYSLAIDSVGNVQNSYYFNQSDYGLNYINIPLSLNYVSGAGKIKIYINGGVYFSLFMNAVVNGFEQYYYDPEDNIDLSHTILNPGLNEYTLSGKTKGIRITDIERSTAENIQYYEEPFNSYDFGMHLFIGVIYQVTPKIGFSLAPGFAYSFTNAFENPTFDYKWRQSIRVKLGFMYTLDMKNNTKE